MKLAPSETVSTVSLRHPTKSYKRIFGILLMCVAGFLIAAKTFLYNVNDPESIQPPTSLYKVPNVPQSTQRPPIFVYKLPNVRESTVRRLRTNITFVNKELCALTTAPRENEKTAVVIVHSARHNFDRRELIRQSYGPLFMVNNIRILAVVFMLGNRDAVGAIHTDTNKLQAEMDRFGDIIMGDFVDTYRNLTLKAIMAYEWLTSSCRQAKFLVKTDDDVVINIFQLTKDIDSWSPSDIESPNICCKVHRNEGTVKDKKSRFYASPVDFPNGIFPDHCAGLGWVSTIEVIDQILEEISRSFLGRVCTHDDVFMTGIMVRHINSLRNSSDTKMQPIKLDDRYGKWISYVLENGREDADFFLRNLMKESPENIGSEDLAKFQSRFGQKAFFLLTHDNKLKFNFQWLWQLIVKCCSK